MPGSSSLLARFVNAAVGPFMPGIVHGGLAVAPANTVAPVISGDAAPGNALSTTNGTWTGTGPLVYSYQWKRNGVAIGGATANAYTLNTTTDAGAVITCDVTATGPGGAATAASNALTCAILNYAAAGGATFTRNSERAAFFGKAGTFYDLVTPWPGVDVRRIRSDGSANLECASRTQVVTSTDLSTWTVSSGTPTVVATAAPNGLNTAFIITDNDAGNYEIIQRATATLTQTGAHVASWFVKKDSDQTRFPEFQHNQGGGGFAHIQIDTQTGAAVIRAQSTWTATAVAVQDCGDWWRLVLRFTTASTAAITVSVIAAASTTLGGATSPTVVGSVTVWNPQIEVGQHPSSPIRNTTGAALAAQPESLTFSAMPAHMRSGRWAIDIHLHTSAGLSGVWAIFSQNNTVTDAFYYNNVTGRFIVKAGNVVVVESNQVAWDNTATITVTLDPAAGSITVAGGTSGNGTVVGTPWSWNNASFTMGKNPNGTFPGMWTFSRPRAA